MKIKYNKMENYLNYQNENEENDQVNQYYNENNELEDDSYVNNKYMFSSKEEKNQIENNEKQINTFSSPLQKNKIEITTLETLSSQRLIYGNSPLQIDNNNNLKNLDSNNILEKNKKNENEVDDYVKMENLYIQNGKINLINNNNMNNENNKNNIINNEQIIIENNNQNNIKKNNDRKKRLMTF